MSVGEWWDNLNLEQKIEVFNRMELSIRPNSNIIKARYNELNEFNHKVIDYYYMELSKIELVC